jgi:hypothetical protein
VRVLEDDYDENDLTDEVWREVKLHYMGLLIDHLRPELAETFFNTVCTKLLNRNYFHNDFIFVRPATSTEYIERDDTPPTYRVYYPATDGLNYTIKRIVTNFQLNTLLKILIAMSPSSRHVCVNISGVKSWNRITRFRCWRICFTGINLPTSLVKGLTVIANIRL